MLRGARANGEVLELEARRLHRVLVQDEVFDSGMESLVTVRAKVVVEVYHNVTNRVACEVRGRTQGRLNRRGWVMGSEMEGGEGGIENVTIRVACKVRGKCKVGGRC